MVRRAIPIRVLSGPSKVAGKPVVIQVARSEAVRWQTVSDLMLTAPQPARRRRRRRSRRLFAGAPRAAPVDRIAERARSVTADRLGERLPADNPSDELGKLTGVINDMLERLESSFAQMRRFTADVCISSGHR